MSKAKSGANLRGDSGPAQAGVGEDDAKQNHFLAF